MAICFYYFSLIFYVPSIFLREDLLVNIYFYVVIASFCIGCTLAGNVKHCNVKFRVSCNTYKADFLFVLYFIISILGIISFVEDYGGIFGAIVNISEVSRNISVQRYGDEGFTLPIMTYFSLIFDWVGVVVFVYAYIRTKERRYLVYGLYFFICVLIISVLQTTKLQVLIAISLLMGLYFSISIINRVERISFKKTVAFSPVLIILLIVFYSAFSMLRYGWAEFDVILLKKLAIYSFGHVKAFSYYLSNENFDFIAFEPWYFIKIFQPLVDVSQQQGIYDEYITVVPGYETNVFTIFRPLIESFGVIGSIFVIFSSGYLSQYVYLKLLEKNSPLYFSLYIFFIVVILLSFVTSMLLFNNVLVVLFLLYFSFLFLWRKEY